MSIEFLLGRSLQNALLNLNLEGVYVEALKDLGFALEELYEQEQDPGIYATHVLLTPSPPVQNRCITS